MRRIIILLTLMVYAGLANAQQDAQQSQYMFNGIYINPAYAGYKENLNLHSFYRAQWTGIQGAPVSMSLAVDASANDGNVGLALQISNDKLGAQSNLAAYANYAYRVRLNGDGTSRLAFGLGIGVMQLGINGSLLDPNDPEPYQPTGTQNYIVPDGRAGVYFSNKRLYVGISADNLISQFGDFKNHAYLAQPKPHFYFTGGALFTLSDDIKLKPSVLLKDDRGGPTSLDGNVFLMFADKIWIGGAYRTAVKLYNKGYLQTDLSDYNAVVGAVEVFPVENLRIGYAYDQSIGPLKGYSGGTHEISIGYYFKTRKSRMLTPRYF